MTMIEMTCDIPEHLIRKHDIFTITSIHEDGFLIQSPKTDNNIRVYFDQFELYSKGETSRMDIIGQNGNCPDLKKFDPEWADKIDSFKGRPDYYDLSIYNRLEDLIAPMPHFRGSAFKYLLRAGKKNTEKELQDLRKARECLDIEIDRLIKGEK